MKRGDPRNGIAVHAHETQHEIDWNGAEVKKMEVNYWKRRTIEAIQIKTSNKTMNLDNGQWTAAPLGMEPNSESTLDPPPPP